MKKLITLFLTAVMILTLSLTAFAAAGPSDDMVIKKGTPTLDGRMDEIYKYSLCIADLGTGANAYTHDTALAWNKTMNADVYFLYDDKYLYIFIGVVDDDVLTKGEDFAKKKDSNPIGNDVFECRLSLNGAESTIKVAVDAYGYGLFGLSGDYKKFNYDAIQYKVVHTDKSWSAEIAIPCTEKDMNMIEASKLGFTYQMNDLDAAGKVCEFTTSFYGEAQKAPVFYKLSAEKAQAPAATQKPAATTGTTASPATADPAIIMAVATVLSGAAAVVISKKR